ncbi:Ubiquinone/menaquinone biosynthesis C-methylase UbiE [Amycolatopsis arida]|uniref:Ubiquinone/menaquinone biosynthesis C-methylase UbiE n=1 Tax=Amycolatopsis arida TaxID=587909 RepID=A0A1I5PDU7_9PSEU|nr:methyltransferase domain-containing protein [Amycolatopsis arida]TDX98456.1 ubiquinone/menaquinone biosynthesis C-methylase UbiE [Amycolatopsis arida]SFP32000.1 Ubiquinone/menaquinone biosynthesis C-methylase UbiE [Amycolatopsis arida]
MPTSPKARERLLDLLTEPVSEPDLAHGYVDLLGGAEQAGPSTGLAQRLMRTTAVPMVYERYWRPALGRVAKGLRGPSMEREVALAVDLLRPRPGRTVLDVACGTGRFTRAFGEAVGAEGLAIGLDGSRQMLAKAVAAEPQPESVAYVRADAVTLPLRPASVQGLCCFAALHLFADPDAALDSFTSTLEPGGRLALFTSARHGWPPARAAITLLGATTGMRMFDRGEIAAKLRDRGFTEITEDYAGVTQIVAGTRAP